MGSIARYVHFIYIIPIILSAILGAQAFATGELAQTFTLDGQLTRSDTEQPLLDAHAKIIVQILDPSKTCLLYEEQQYVDTTTSNGYYNIQVGSATGASKRTGNDPGRTMVQVYQNTAAITANSATGQTCTGGVYTPAINDSRYFRLIVTPSATNVADTLSPDTPMDSVATALVAQTLQGYAPSQFLQIGTGDLTQANLQTVFASGNTAKLTSLLATNPSNYVVKDATNGTILIPSLTAPASPAAGQIWYEGGALKYYNGTTTQTVGTSSGVTSVTAGTGLNVGAGPGGTITSTGTLNVDVGVSAGQIVQVQTGGKLPALDGSSLTGLTGTQIQSGTIGGTTAVATSGNIQTTADITAKRLYMQDNGSNYVGLKAPAAVTATYSLTFPAAQGGANSILVNDGSGNLSWATQNAGTVTSVSVTAPITAGGTAAAPVIGITQADATNNGYLTSTDWTAFNGKLTSTLADGKVFVGNGSNVATAVTPSGDLTMTNAGVFTVAKIQGTGVSATAPTGAGQVMRFDGTNWKPNFVAMTDLRSTVTGSAQFGTMCTSGQTLTFDSVADTMACTNLSVGASNFSSQTANTFLAAPNGSNGTPVFRTIAAADLPSVVFNGGQAGAVTVGTSNSNNLTFNTNGSTRMTILANGNVGIGTTPNYLLDLGSGTANVGTLQFQSTGSPGFSAGNNFIHFKAAGSNGLVITAAANINYTGASTGSAYSLGFSSDSASKAYAIGLDGSGLPLIQSNVADGATAVAHRLDTQNSYSTAGAKLLSVRNNTTEKMSVSKDGQGYFAGGIKFADGTTQTTAATTGSLTSVSSISNSGSISLDPSAGNSVIVNQTTASTSSTSGALIVNGGAGVAGAVNAGGNIVSDGMLQGRTLKLTTTTADNYTTPVGSAVPTKINIPYYDPGSYGQVVAMGISSTAHYTSRVLSLFDARTGNHQPTINIFSPDENQSIGFSYDGSNTLGAVKTTGDLALRTGTYDGVTIIQSTGNVGIGNSSPSTTLHVLSSDVTWGGTAFESTAAVGGTFATTANMRRTSGVGNGVGTSFNMYNSSNTMAEYGYMGALIETNTAGSQNGAIAFYPRRNASRTEAVRITSAGNVGIGTSSPGDLLTVRKDQNAITRFSLTNATNGVAAEAQFMAYNNNGDYIAHGIYSTSAAGSSFAPNGSAYETTSSPWGLSISASNAVGVIRFGTGGTNNERMRIDASGNVGIGNASPNSALDVKGISGDVSSLGIMRYNTNNGTNDMGVKLGAVAGAGSAGYSFIQSLHTGVANDGNLILNPSGSGYVGIGTTSPSAPLEVNGVAKATTFTTTSDRRLKTNIRPVSGLEGILKLRGVEFDWIKNGRHEIGLIAQEVEEVYPELVLTSEVDGMKSVKYSNLVSPLIESVKELHGMCSASEAQIAELKLRVDTLAKENRHLRDELTELRKLILERLPAGK